VAAARHLFAAFDEARARTDALFALVRPDSLYERPIPERHRIVFYIGHLEAFDWNLLSGPLGLRPFHEGHDRLFAFGIDPPPGRLPEDTPSDWPSLPEVHAYNTRVREMLDPRLAEAPEQLLHVALEHRLMHVETFAYMLHNLPFERKLPPAVRPAPAGPRPAPAMVELSAATVTLGVPRGTAFGWDNEFEAHTVPVGAFAIGKYKVTNGEYLAFVEQGAAPPHFWTRRDGRWLYRGMFEEIPLPLDWPVYATHEQASAYAAWAGKRLPTEAEFHRAAWGTEGEAPATPRPACDNFDYHRWDPVPVGAAGENPRGVAQMVGNGWEWTASVFEPFPGFEPFPFYPGYSANFFDGSHYVIKGASPMTAARLARPAFRNWFRPAYPYLYATFRLAES